jgi:hypothetical protein
VAVAIGWPDQIAAWTPARAPVRARCEIRAGGCATVGSANTLTSAGTRAPDALSSGPRVRRRARKLAVAPQRPASLSSQASARRLAMTERRAASPSGASRAPGPVCCRSPHDGRCRPSHGYVTCAMSFFVSQQTHLLESFATTSPRFTLFGGVHVGMASNAASRREHVPNLSGCVQGIFLDTRDLNVVVYTAAVIGTQLAGQSPSPAAPYPTSRSTRGTSASASISADR